MAKNIKKSTTITKQPAIKHKKKVNFFLRHPLILPSMIFIAVIFMGMLMFIVLGATTGGAKDKHIVNLYIDGQKQTVSTRAKTVGELFERIDIELKEEDIVEPVRESRIIDDDTQVNVYRARPVSVIDGNRTITLLSAHRAPRLLANEAGIKLHPEDEAILQSAETDLLENTSPEQVIIIRSIPIQLNVFGAIRQYRTTASTVVDVLNENNITLQEGETIQPEDINAKVIADMLISINAPGKKTVAVTEELPFETQIITDDNLEVGERELRTQGQNGIRAVIYEITEENGQETGRREIQTIITKQPINEIYARGTKPATLGADISVAADKAALMAAAGIAASDYPYADYIISRESNWRPGAYNAGSGAYGLCQSLPASKMASAGADYLTNPVTQLRWCTGYASRYGGWQGAYNAWLVQGWW